MDIYDISSAASDSLPTSSHLNEGNPLQQVFVLHLFKAEFLQLSSASPYRLDSRGSNPDNNDCLEPLRTALYTTSFISNEINC